MVRMKDLETNQEWVWPRQKFFNRKYIMQEMYNEFVEGDEWKLPAVRYCFTNVFFFMPSIAHYICVEMSNLSSSKKNL